MFPQPTKTPSRRTPRLQVLAVAIATAFLAAGPALPQAAQELEDRLLTGNDIVQKVDAALGERNAAEARKMLDFVSRGTMAGAAILAFLRSVDLLDSVPSEGDLIRADIADVKEQIATLRLVTVRTGDRVINELIQNNLLGETVRFSREMSSHHRRVLLNDLASLRRVDFSALETRIEARLDDCIAGDTFVAIEQATLGSLVAQQDYAAFLGAALARAESVYIAVRRNDYRRDPATGRNELIEEGRLAPDADDATYAETAARKVLDATNALFAKAEGCNDAIVAQYQRLNSSSRILANANALLDDVLARTNGRWPRSTALGRSLKAQFPQREWIVVRYGPVSGFDMHHVVRSRNHSILRFRTGTGVDLPRSNLVISFYNLRFKSAQRIRADDRRYNKVVSAFADDFAASRCQDAGGTTRTFGDPFICNHIEGDLREVRKRFAETEEGADLNFGTFRIVGRGTGTSDDMFGPFVYRSHSDSSGYARAAHDLALWVITAPGS